MRWLNDQFELQRAGQSPNVRAMEGLRGFAAFLVFLAHYCTLIRPWIDRHSAVGLAASSLQKIGLTGVDLFFVLSGYLIYGALITRRQPFLPFLSRRIVRIYPTFIPVFLLYVGLSFLFPAESRIPSSPPQALTYLAENFLLLPGVLPLKPMITVAWSLSYEMFYYLVIPMIIDRLDLRERDSRSRILIIASIAVAATLVFAACGGPVRLITFTSGIVLYEAIHGLRIDAPHSRLALPALIAGLTAFLLPVRGVFGAALQTTVVSSSFLLFCFCVFQRPLEWLPRCFCWTPMRWFGNMSYSYYLLHGLALKFCFLMLPFVLTRQLIGPLFCTLLLAATFTITLIPTMALFLAVERPFSLRRPTVNRDPPVSGAHPA